MRSDGKSEEAWKSCLRFVGLVVLGCSLLYERETGSEESVWAWVWSYRTLCHTCHGICLVGCGGGKWKTNWEGVFVCWSNEIRETNRDPPIQSLKSNSCLHQRGKLRDSLVSLSILN
jgi:hypothetical protein